MSVEMNITCLSCKRAVDENRAKMGKAFCEWCEDEIFYSKKPERALSAKAYELEKRVERERIVLGMVQKMLNKLD